MIREERYESVRRECTRSRILLRDSGKVDTRRLIVEVVGRVGQVDAFASNHGYVNACSSELDVAAELDIAERRLLRLKWRLSGFELVAPNMKVTYILDSLGPHTSGRQKKYEGKEALGVEHNERWLCSRRGGWRCGL